MAEEQASERKTGRPLCCCVFGIFVFVCLFFLKFQSFPVPLRRAPQSPLLGGDGQRLGAGLLGLLCCRRLLVAAAGLEEVRVDEDFPKTAFIDDPTTYFLSKRKMERTKHINKAEE